MDWAVERRLVVPQSRVSPLGNTLVLVAGAGAAPVAIEALPGTTGRIAVGDPAHVPAGRYAAEALGRLGLLTTLAPRFARAENVRAALLLVERARRPMPSSMRRMRSRRPPCASWRPFPPLATRPSATPSP
jgi:molybdate transport system substrate-binding protein